MKDTGTAYITLGKVASSHGVRGWLKIQSYTTPIERIFDYKPWRLAYPQAQGKTHIIELEDWKPHGKGVIAKFIGI